MRQTRRQLFAFGVAAGVVAMGGAAFACTPYIGKLTITGTGSTTSVTEGAGAADTFCSVSGGAEAALGGTITVAVEPVSSSCANSNGNNQMAPSYDYIDPSTQQLNRGIGEYDIMLHTGEDGKLAFNRSGSAYTFSQDTNSWCSSPDNPGNWLLGKLSVGTNGMGTQSVSLPSSGPGSSGPSDSASVCVNNFNNSPAQNDPEFLMWRLYRQPYGWQYNAAPLVIL